MSDQVIDSSSEAIVPEDFQNANALIDSIAQPKDSQPTKTKVKNFKNRVFQLLKIYTCHSTDINPLISCFKQEMFLREPQKMKELLDSILNKQNVTLENLQQLLEFYKVVLLYKNDKNSGNVAAEFVRILKKIASIDAQKAKETILQILKAFAWERKCQLKMNFFFYFFRKYQNSAALKKVVIQKCLEYMNDEKLRNAQKKQLNKLLGKLDKAHRKSNVKRQEPSEDEEQDDIKVNEEKKKLKIKAEKIEHKNSHKIQEEGKQGEQVQEVKQKKAVSKEQEEKLQRIKQNKKKNKNKKKNQKGNQSNQNDKPQQNKSQNKPVPNEANQNKNRQQNRSQEKPVSKPAPNQARSESKGKPQQNESKRPESKGNPGQNGFKRHDKSKSKPKFQKKSQ